MPTQPTMYSGVRLHTVLTYLAAAIEQAMTAAGLPAHNRIVVTTGDPADDYCQCGSLTFTVNNTFRSYGFPNDGSETKPGNCNQMLVVANCSLRALRCVHGPDQNGEGPVPGALIADALVTLRDADVASASLLCLLAELYEPASGAPQIADYLVAGTSMVTHEGGCGGSETPFKIAFFADYCGC